MSRVFLTMAMSLDGFITGPHDDAQNPAGIDGMRLMDWLDGVGRDEDADNVEGYRPADPASQLVFDERLSTGAVITGNAPPISPATGAATTTTECRSSSPRTDRQPTTRTTGPLRH